MPLCGGEAADRLGSRISEFVRTVAAQIEEAKLDAEAADKPQTQPPPSPSPSEAPQPEPAKDAGNAPPADEGPNDKYVPPLSQSDLDFEEEQERQFQEQVKLIGTAGKRLADKEYVVGVLRAEQKPKAGDLKRLREILKWTSEHDERSLIREQEFKQRIEPRVMAAQLALASAPENLITLDQYRRRIERDIERKLLLLEGP